MANYSKRDDRRADTARAVAEDRHRPPGRDPELYRCSVCGVERSETVRIIGHFVPMRPVVLYCEQHLPEDFR